MPGDPHFPWSGQLTRKDQILGFFMPLWPMTVECETSVRVDHFIVAGDHFVMTGEFDHMVAASRQRLQIKFAVYFIVEDRKIAYMHMYEDTLATARAFMLGVAT